MAEVTTEGGKLSKQTWYVIGGIGAAYVGYRWYKAKHTSANANAAVAGATPPGQSVGVDPMGNPVYLDANGNIVDANGNPDTLAPTGGTGPGTYQNPNPQPASGLPPAGTAPTTDEQWTAAVVQDLENIGYDPQAVATALAQYLGSQPLTSDQVVIVRLAWAYEGRPPQHPSLPINQSGGTTPPPPPPGGGSGGGTPPPPPPGGGIGGGNPPSGGPPVPVPPPGPAYTPVTVVRFGNPAPWNSTMWGIAQHYGYGSAGDNYLPIWNDSKNAGLKAMRITPTNIQPGDVVYVIPK